MIGKVGKCVMIACVVIVLCGVTTNNLKATRWFASDVPGAQPGIDRVCRDGMVIGLRYNEFQDPEVPPPVDNGYTFVVRRYLGEQENDGYYTTNDNGELLVEEKVTFADTLLRFDQRGGELSENYWNGTALLVWPYYLQPGTKIIVGGENISVSEVKDCLINKFVVSEHSLGVIEQSRLPGEPSSALNESIYIVNRMPKHGNLLLDGIPLEIGDVVSQDNINSGQLLYEHNDSTIATDSTVFIARATRRMSLNNEGQEGGEPSWEPSILMDGRAGLVAFTSLAALVGEDGDAMSDVYSYDFAEDKLFLNSISYDLISSGNGPSHSPTAGFRGKVIFASEADNLVITSDPRNCQTLSDTNDHSDIYRNDQVGNIRLSVFLNRVSSNCVQTNGYSGLPEIFNEGSDLFVFESDDVGGLVPSDTDNVRDIYERVTNVSFQEVSVAFNDDDANGNSYAPSSSYFGDVIAFESDATNLLALTQDLEFRDIFAYAYGDIEYVSMAFDGSEANGNSYYPSVSFDGRYVVFASDARNLLPLNEQLDYRDIYVRDVISHTTTRITNKFDGGEASGDSSRPVISADGRYIAFESEASDLLGSPESESNYRGIYLHDRDADGNDSFDEPEGTYTSLISISSTGTPGNGDSFRPSISRDGSYVAFDSLASNLVDDDTNGVSDVFVHYVGFTAELPIFINSTAVTKTVGTDASTCAVEQVVMVEPSTPLYHCITIENTGAITLTDHTIVDAGLSISLTVPYTLGPGTKLTVTKDWLESELDSGALLGPITMTDTTSSTVVVTSTIYNTLTDTLDLKGPTGVYTATGSSLTTVNVLNVAASAEQTVGVISDECGTSSRLVLTEDMVDDRGERIVYFCNRITNTGNVPLTIHSLDDSQLDSILDNYVYNLEPGSSFSTLDAGLTVKANISETSTFTATWTSIYQGDFGADNKRQEPKDISVIIVSSATVIPDLDNDDIADEIDDSDGDGFTDSVEGAADVDSDGIPNYLDIDANGNGILDGEEGDNDSDSDGIPDFLDLTPTALDETDEPSALDNALKLYFPLLRY